MGDEDWVAPVILTFGCKHKRRCVEKPIQVTTKDYAISIVVDAGTAFGGNRITAVPCHAIAVEP
jgi:hypothetical protein